MVGPWGYTLAQSFSCLQPHAKTSHKFFSNSQILKFSNIFSKFLQ